METGEPHNQTEIEEVFAPNDSIAAPEEQQNQSAEPGGDANMVNSTIAPEQEVTRELSPEELTRQRRIAGLNKARANRWAKPDQHTEQSERVRRSITPEARSRGGKLGAATVWSKYGQAQRDRMMGNKYAVGKGRPKKNPENN